MSEEREPQVANQNWVSRSSQLSSVLFIGLATTAYVFEHYFDGKGIVLILLRCSALIALAAFAIFVAADRKKLLILRNAEGDTLQRRKRQKYAGVMFIVLGIVWIIAAWSILSEHYLRTMDGLFFAVGGAIPIEVIGFGFIFTNRFQRWKSYF